MENPGIIDATRFLLMALIVLVFGVFSSKISAWLKVPDVVVLLIVGILVGPPALHLIDLPAESAVNQIVLIFGASYILFEGGSGLSLKVIKKVWLTISFLALPGVLISVVIVGFAAAWLIGMPLLPAFLLAAVIAPTDPATLVPIFKQVKIRERVTQTVISESAFNDATGSIVAFTILGLMTMGSFSAGKSLLNFILMAGGGILTGIVLGFLAIFLIAHTRYKSLTEHAPFITLIVVISAYLLGEKIGASGFMAVFVIGILIGNLESFVFKSIIGKGPVHEFKLDQEHQGRMHHFIELISTLCRVFIFILLGTHVNIELIRQYFIPGIGVMFVFMFIARPMTVLCSTLPDVKAKWKWNEIFFMFWTRETGVIPAALSGLLVGAKAPYADVIASITFMSILFTILIQASTTKWLAGKLDLLEKKR
jgi:cell volume regulation protein A